MNSKGLSEILRDIRTFNKCVCSLTPEVNIVGYFRCSGNAQIASLFTVTGIGIFFTFGTPYV